MTSENLDKKLESAKFALDAKFKKFQEEKRLKEEAANKKDDEKRKFYFIHTMDGR